MANINLRYRSTTNLVWWTILILAVALLVVWVLMVFDALVVPLIMPLA